MNRIPSGTGLTLANSDAETHNASSPLFYLKESDPALISNQEQLKFLTASTQTEKKNHSNHHYPKSRNSDLVLLTSDCHSLDLFQGENCRPLCDLCPSLLLLSPVIKALGDSYPMFRNSCQLSLSNNQVALPYRPEIAQNEMTTEVELKVEGISEKPFMPNKSTRTQHFDGVYNLLMKVFLETNPITPKEFDLKPTEKGLFGFLMQRKFDLSRDFTTNFSSLDVSQMTEMIQTAAAKDSSKRIEERKKFVFKQVFKLIKAQFCGTNKIRFHPGNSDQFYQHYFGELLSVREDINLSMFYDPLNPKLKNPVFKTLSNEYLEFIFQSASFKASFLANMDLSNFLSSYRKGMAQKLENLLVRWEKLMDKNTPEDDILREMTKYFRENRQCKFPWTSKEIKHALKSFEKFIPNASL